VFFIHLAMAAATHCVDTKADVRTLMTRSVGAEFSQVLESPWSETTADDGKPLQITVSEQEGKLYMVFNKTKEGIWAEGPAQVCESEGDLKLKIIGKTIKLGQAAPWPIRWSMSDGASLGLKFKASDKLHVSTTGWSGDFVPGKANEL